MNQDRNFDDLADKFQRKVYGGVKGQVRLAVLRRDLEAILPGVWQPAAKPLRVLDIGAGLGQLAIALARCGHRVTVNDISFKMLEKARGQAAELGVAECIDWRCCSYQQLLTDISGQKFDLILCHALMEWLAEPLTLVEHLALLLAENGFLSLTFYNRHALVYRNLLRGNFKLLESDQLSGDSGSLTPGKPQQPKHVEQLVVQAGLRVASRSGIRVFNDYVQVPRGGNENPEAIVDMELRYSTDEPYLWLGRYIHFICQH